MRGFRLRTLGTARSKFMAKVISVVRRGDEEATIRSSHQVCITTKLDLRHDSSRSGMTSPLLYHQTPGTDNPPPPYLRQPKSVLVGLSASPGYIGQETRIRRMIRTWYRMEYGPRMPAVGGDLAACYLDLAVYWRCRVVMKLLELHAEVKCQI